MGAAILFVHNVSISYGWIKKKYLRSNLKMSSDYAPHYEYSEGSTYGSAPLPNHSCVFLFIFKKIMIQK